MTTAASPGATPMWTIADRLRKARIHADLEQDELADLIEVSRGTISNYERGEVEPKRIVVRQWAIATGVSLDWLRGTTTSGGEDETAPPAGIEPATNRLEDHDWFQAAA